MEIIRIAKGQKITKPGFYMMSLEHYHSDCCDGPSISSTGLRKIVNDSPLHYWDDSYLNPDREPEDPDKVEAVHFRLGRAGHYLMLEPDLFKANFAVRPEEYGSWRTDSSKAWRKQQQRAGKTVLSPAEYENALSIAKTLSTNRWHTEGILSGLVEVSMVVRDKKTGIWLKSRPDSIPTDAAFSELKIMASSKPDDVDRSIRTLGYDVQMSLAGICYHALTGVTIDRFWIIAIERPRPHAIHVASISSAATYWARIRIRKALDTMDQCLRSGYWPAYGEDGREVHLKDWEIKRLTIEQNSGLLPKEDEF